MATRLPFRLLRPERRKEKNDEETTRPAAARLCAATLLASVAAPALADVSTAVRQSTHPVVGLQAPAEIILDQWGIPHIYAGSTRDAVFLQGYNAARDRL